MTKVKDGGKLTEATKPVESEFSADTVKVQLEEKVEYHNKLVTEKERLMKEYQLVQQNLQKIESALSQNLGGIDTLQSLQKEYFVTDTPSANGEA